MTQDAPRGRLRRLAGYVGRKAADTVISTLTAAVVALGIAMVGVGATQGVQRGIEVPGEIVQGFAHLVQAADKYLRE